MNKYRELAAAIRKGHTMIGETNIWLHPKLVNGTPACGCALGAAAVANGYPIEFTDSNKLYSYLRKAMPNVDTDLLDKVSMTHYSGKKTRLQIADWLDTLADEEEGKPVREDDLAYAKRKVAQLFETVTA